MDCTSRGGLQKCKEESWELLPNLVKGVSNPRLATLGTTNRDKGTFVFYIKVQSVLDSDSATAVTTPSNPQRRFSTAAFRRDERSVVATPPTNHQQDRGHPHVLLVEDNVVNQRVLGKQLEKAGCVVHIANNGVEALSVLTAANSQRRREKRDVRVDVVL